MARNLASPRRPDNAPIAPQFAPEAAMETGETPRVGSESLEGNPMHSSRFRRRDHARRSDLAVRLRAGRQAERQQQQRYEDPSRFLMEGQKPPKDAVRVEEMVNYFAYAYPGPDDATRRPRSAI
jgi:hypothetical protein